MDTVVVVNPRSANGKTEKRWPQLREIIHEAYGPFETRFTQGAGDGTAQARAALQGGAKLVVAIGGDGTINEVVNGFFTEGENPKAVAPSAAFAVLNAGTGGDFVKTLLVPKDIREASLKLKSAVPRPIDIGRLTYVASDGSPAVRHFVNIASFGISGLVDRYVNETTKVLGGTFSFAVATLRAGARYKNAEVRLEIDGKVREGRVYTVAIANGRFFGGGMKVAPDAILDDSVFDVVTLGDFGIGDLLLRGLDIYSGKHISNPKVTVERARVVEATPLDPHAEVLLDVDGEQPGRLPARFEILPGGINVRWPA
jgi:YegS/Rv2252/BmrU family lipid kinase